MAITGAEISRMASRVASLGDMSFVDVDLHGFHHHNGIIDHNTDGQHERKKR